MLEAVAPRPRRRRAGSGMLEPAEVPEVNPAVRGPVLGAMLCTRRDRRARPGAAGAARRRWPIAVATPTSAAGRRSRPSPAACGTTPAPSGADLTILCPGAAHTGVAAPWLADAPLRRCRLQMMQTAPLDERLTTSVADGDSLRYYPAFAVPEAAALPAQAPIAAQWHAQLLVSQRAGGELTIGDTHVYEEPYDFAVEEEPYEHLQARAESILGRSLPPVQRRWAGVYSQATDASACVRVTPEPGLVIVTGPGGRGMTLSPAIAAETFESEGVVIRLAVLDMAGTTVSDGGVVERSFVEALAGMGFDPDGAELRRHLDYVRATMGQSKITVFRSVFDGDEERAQEANRRFEAAFDAAVSRGEIEPLPGAEAALESLRTHGARICLTTGFSAATREQLMDVLGWRDLVDLYAHHVGRTPTPASAASRSARGQEADPPVVHRERGAPVSSAVLDGDNEIRRRHFGQPSASPGTDRAEHGCLRISAACAVGPGRGALVRSRA